jgi:hypothetical protein
LTAYIESREGSLPPFIHELHWTKEL